MKIYLDVDGVLNSLWSRENRLCVNVDGYDIWYTPEVVEYINELGQEHEIVWLTTWGDRAASGIAPAIGLDSFRWLPGRDWYFNGDGCEERAGVDFSTPGFIWWKADLLAADCEPGDEVVWIDDDIHDWDVREVEGCGVHVTAIVPDQLVGVGIDELPVLGQM